MQQQRPIAPSTERSGTPGDKRDFLISYNKADRAWAEWAGTVLERAGYQVLIDVWDFKGNFVAHMHDAQRRAERTLALLSDNYFGSDFTLAEWTAQYARDPAMREDRLVPVVVGPVSQASLLDPILHADLFACGGNEEQARETLLDRVARATDLEYGAKRRAQPHAFPGRAEAAPGAATPRLPVPIHNLPPYNPDFVGREEVLEGLQELLGTGSGPAVLTQAITGLGGVGKTQTALAYCYRHLAAHTVIWWLRAEQSATLPGQLVALAPHLGLDPTTADQDALVRSIREGLAARGGFLLVFDNLEEPDLLPAFLPRTGGQVLITARQRDWRGRASTLPLDVMSEPEAVHLLTGAGKASDLPEPARSQAKALAEELGYLPLALAQARSYVAATGETLEGYRALLAESRPAMLAEGRAHPDYPATVAKTWDVSVHAAERECAAARELLELLAFFAPDPLPRPVLEADPDALPEGLRGKLAGNRAIAALARFSLVTATEGRITVHRLVQAVTRDGLDEATSQMCAEAAVRLVNAALPRPSWEHTNWPAIGALLPHALAVAAGAEQLGIGLDAAGTILNETALYHHARAAWAEAEPLLQRAIAIIEKALGPKHPDLAAGLNNLATLFRDTGRHAEAEPLFRRAIAIGEKTLGPEHPNLAAGLNNLATLFRDTGRHAEAEPLYQRAIAIFEQTLPPDHPHLMMGLANHATCLEQLGRDQEAAQRRARAEAIRQRREQQR